MLTAAEIKNVDFSKSINGYKREEVELFLDRVEADYAHYDYMVNEYQAKIEDLEKQIEEYKASQASIQNVLLNAQKLADQIVNDARVKSEEIVRNAETNITAITSQEKELAAVFEAKATERKNALQQELDQMVAAAELKAKCVESAMLECVRNQQTLFEKIKLEIAAFKADISSKYKEHLGILQQIPDTIDNDPVKVAEIISAKIDNMSELDKFLPHEEEEESQQIVEETQDVEEPSGGFVIEQDVDL